MEARLNQDLVGSRTPAPIRARLSLMMFLQYFIQGSYLPVASLYVEKTLGFSGSALGIFGSALAVGPLFAPFVVGQLVDRHWSTQRVLAVSHCLSGVIMLWLFTVTGTTAVIVLGTIYSILYVPTMMLTNSLAFHHLRNGEREFPRVRLFGTIGFVVPAWWVEFYWLGGLEGQDLNNARGIIFLLAGLAGLVMALYCWTLPSTPPEKRDAGIAPAKVIGLFRLRPLAALVIISFFVAMVHKFYFLWNSPFLSDILAIGEIKTAWEQRISSIGQITEVLVMVGLAWMIRSLGFKRTMLVGIAAYTMRCLLFAIAIGKPLGSFSLAFSLVLFGQALHGVCFACFMAAAFMFVDRISTKDVRGSMQNIYGTFVLGLGFFVAGVPSGALGDWLTTPKGQPTVRDEFRITSETGLVLVKSDEQVDFDREFGGPGFRISKLATGDPDSSPISRLNVGDVLLTVDGKPIAKGASIHSTLTGIDLREIKLNVRNKDGKERSVTIRPVRFTPGKGLFYKRLQLRDWPGLWLSCGLLSFLCLVGFWILFPKNVSAEIESVKSPDDNSTTSC